MDDCIHRIKLHRFRNDKLSEQEDIVAVEEPLEIQVKVANENQPKSISVTMRTPGDDEELALGFLFTEGLISSYSAIKAVKYIGENIIRVIMNEGVTLDVQTTARNFYTTSSCGVCAKASIEAIHTKSNFNCESKHKIENEVLFSLKEKLAKQQSLFTQTGGIHAAALFSCEGELLSLREDVGRHNALDKLIGNTFKKQNLPLSNAILMLSGRASFELVQKATMSGIRHIVSVGAPSSLAVQLARENGQNLIGFLKNQSYNVYS